MGPYTALAHECSAPLNAENQLAWKGLLFKPLTFNTVEGFTAMTKLSLAVAHI